MSERISQKDLTRLIHTDLKENGNPVSLADVEATINTFKSVVAQAILEGNVVNLHGFGRFEAPVAASRTARNPKTGEPVEVPSRRRPKFKPSRSLLKD